MTYNAEYFGLPRMTKRSGRIDWRGATHRGSVRDHNEDCFLAMPERGVWLVADGMGGHDRGDWASAQVAAAVEAMDMATDFNGIMDSCAKAIHRANRSIFEAASARDTRIGSTVAALVLADGHYGAMWAGDTRIYLLRGQEMVPLTRDHTQVQQLVDRGMIGVEDARVHPLSHILSRAVGAAMDIELDLSTGSLSEGDRFLLCSDGIHGTLSEDQLRDAMAANLADDPTQRLIAQCLTAGARDNITAILVGMSSAEAMATAANAPVNGTAHD